MQINYREKFKVIAAIADVHIGNRSISHKEYKYQLKNGVIEKMKSMPFLDGIVICGDLLHYQISMNSEYADVFQWFVASIIKIAKAHNAFVRIIKGTKSHDLDQLETIRHYEDDFGIDFKIVNDFMIENIDGLQMAYIAESYIKDEPEKYYSEIFSKSENYFDMIFMHGMIEPCKFKTQESENIDSSAPVFKLKSFYDVTRGPIIGGHIHTPMVFNDKFYYVGSTLRTCHGEEEPKGWDIIVYIPETGDYRVDKIINEFTFNFSTIKLNNDFIKNNDIDKIIFHIESYMKDNKIDKLSVKIICTDDNEISNKNELLKSYFAKNTNINISFKILSDRLYEQEEKGLNEREKKSYLQEGLDIIDRIYLWAKCERGIDLNKDDISRFLQGKKLQRKGIDNV